jgi:CheY-like chemotaxis protein
MPTLGFLLLVDDDIDDQQIFLEALDHVAPGIKVITASNGLEALHKLNTPGAVYPDLIFLDLNMPMMNGKELLEELKRTESFAEIPVIIYTTSSRAEDREESMQLGATNYLVKPQNFNDLCEQLRSALKD